MKHLSKLILLSTLVVFAIGAKYQAHRRSAFASVPTYEWLTNYTTFTPRNDFSGWVGCFFTPVSNITLTHLGRWVVAGNSAAHTVKILVNGDVAIASVSVTTSGAAAGQVKYVEIAPVTLTGGQQYVLASEELALGDQWYEVGAANSARVRWDKATANDAVFSVLGTTFSGTLSGTNAIYVPVSFKFR